MATTDLDDDTKRDVRAEFGEAVNMTAPGAAPEGDVTTRLAVLADELGHDPLK